ncbi:MULTISPECIES: hypothetical protein [unclassified Pseudomonas]|uniref:hypothetical protein n=1 Tax=unclassified Pseudomonas TaxID=196821 RepID=UPI0002A38C6F|nr:MULTISPECIES: hypothetical protein [unclassified Pseudomonas]MBB1606116.1 hypothetical protein [Pseudomonas sp. UMC76]MBB1636589.1 hypothetical protein [Pseudomonas sp. UME83]NTX92242.1 hypothetical protein [Pseudomonas sp. UMA643]NTY19976.1 hypothetical protein [Pseudomonas sp. UMC3103]NTY27652.1 hypothetical protein [Pseudomonas sp. UMA603]
MRYFDCTRFDYKSVAGEDITALVERDKSAYKHSFATWINNEIEQITERKWQIDNIGVVEEAGDFIRLIKEAELTYALGAFYSTIALTGIASEDLCKYFAKRTSHIDLQNATQHVRLQKLKERGELSEETHKAFDAIRIIRNDCLHFNDDFKTRDQNTLGAEALNCINSLKAIYKELFSPSNSQYKSGEIITKIIEDFAHQQVYKTSFGDTLNQEEFAMKLRYFMAEELKIDVAISNPGDKVTQTDLFRIEEIDFEVTPKEITLHHIPLGIYTTIDLTDEDIKKIQELDLSEGDTIFASIYSILNHQGMSATWYFETFITSKS